MNAKSIILATAVAATTLAGSLGAAEARNRNFWPGVAVGAAAGLVVGGALAQPGYAAPAPGYVIEEEPEYAPPPPPRRVYRAPVPVCETYIKYDYAGRPYEWKDCN
jgi:hypothetical protein